MAWDRSSLLRQGSCLADVSLKYLQLENWRPRPLALVISHDCDVVADLDREPNIELIVGTIIEVVDGNLTNAKNARLLHLPVQQGSKTIIVELCNQYKRTFEKAMFVGMEPDPDRILVASAKNILARWLAARYRRSAFPDSLNERLRLISGSFERIVKKSPYAIQGIYLQCDPQIELEPEEPYELKITVVYSSDHAGAAAEAALVIEQLRRKFEETFKTIDTALGKQWQGIDLSSCEAVSDLAFSLRQVQTWSLYNLDHLSLKAVPQAVLPE